MLNIDESFFKEEERLNFIIPEAMKKVWAIQLCILDEILTIAKKHNISIWMEYGSLLGAVRHGGYIPWDDDIDLCLLRDDYMKFLFILQKELPPERVVRSFYTQKEHSLPQAFVANRSDIDIGIDPKEKELTRKMFGCPFSIGIDIFPLDFIPKDDNYWNQVKELYKIVYYLGINFDDYKKTGELEYYICQVESTLNTSVDRGANIRNSIWKIADAVAMMTTIEEAGFLTWYPEFGMYGDNRKRSIDAYSDTIWVDFEMLKVPIPIGYDEVLKMQYGANYLTPVHGAASHDYPHYKVQEKKILFHNKIGQMGDIY